MEIGPEIVTEAVKVIGNAVAAKYGHKFDYTKDSNGRMLY